MLLCEACLLGVMVYEQLSAGPPRGPEQVTAMLGREKMSEDLFH